MKQNAFRKWEYLFWDIDVSELDVRKHAEFIIERVLEKGDWDSVRWLRGGYPKSEIEQVVNSSRDISPGTRGLWQAFFDYEQRNQASGSAVSPRSGIAQTN